MVNLTGSWLHENIDNTNDNNNNYNSIDNDNNNDNDINNNNSSKSNSNNSNYNDDYTFPVRRPGVHLDHLKIARWLHDTCQKLPDTRLDRQIRGLACPCACNYVLAAWLCKVSKQFLCVCHYLYVQQEA